MIEDDRKTIHSGLSTGDPLRVQGCIFGDINCMVSPEYRCDTTGMIYRIECSICRTEVLDSKFTDRYIGKKGRASMIR